jgi:hypothetical protein
VANVFGGTRFLGLEGPWLLAFTLLAAGAAVGLLLVLLRGRSAGSGLTSLLERGADARTLREWLVRRRLVQGEETFTTAEIGLLSLAFPAAALAGWQGLPWRAESWLGHVGRGASWLGIALVVGSMLLTAAGMIVEGAQQRVADRLKGSDDPRCREIVSAWKAARKADVAPKVEAMLRSDRGPDRTRAASELRALLRQPSHADAVAEAVADLGREARDADDSKRPRILRALGLVGDGSAREDVAVFLAVGDAATESEAARALARLGDPRGLEALAAHGRFRKEALERQAEIFAREKFWQPAAESGRTLPEVPDDAWDNVAALVKWLTSGEEDLSASAAAKLAAVNPRSTLAPLLGPVLVNRLVRDWERLPGRTILILVSGLAAMDPRLVSPRDELVPAIRKAAEHTLSAGVTTGLFDKVIEDHLPWALERRAAGDSFEGAFREALARADGAAISRLLGAVAPGVAVKTKGEADDDRRFDEALHAAFEQGVLGVPPPAAEAERAGADEREGPLSGLARACAERILLFLGDPKTLEFEKRNDAWWSRDDLVAVLFTAGLQDGVPPEELSEAARHAIDELVSRGRILGTASGYRGISC